MPPPKVLFFDLDGVLVDSEPLHRATWGEAFARCGIELADRRLMELQGLRGEQVARWVKQNLGPAGEAIDVERLMEIKRDRFEARMRQELRSVPGVEPFLRGLKGRVPLALVTSSRLKVVGQILAIFNWRNIFDALVGAEHVQHHKPHPEPFLRAAERFRLPAGDGLAFEDSIPGIAAARSAGAAVCGVATTLSPAELRRAGARWVVSDFRESATLTEALAGRARRRLFAFLGRE